MANKDTDPVHWLLTTVMHRVLPRLDQDRTCFAPLYQALSLDADSPDAPQNETQRRIDALRQVIGEIALTQLLEKSRGE